VTGRHCAPRRPRHRPGDLIWVPERPDTTIWHHLMVLIAVTAQVATIIAVVKQ
jgi:hypothetical protein